MDVYQLELPRCKFCPGVLLPDTARKNKVRGFLFYRCEECDRPNIFAVTPKDAQPAWTR